MIREYLIPGSTTDKKVFVEFTHGDPYRCEFSVKNVSNIAATVNQHMVHIVDGPTANPYAVITFEGSETTEGRLLTIISNRSFHVIIHDSALTGDDITDLVRWS